MVTVVYCRTYRTERPTTTAHSLILHRGDVSVISPIDRSRGNKVQRRQILGGVTFGEVIAVGLTESVETRVLGGSQIGDLVEFNVVNRWFLVVFLDESGISVPQLLSTRFFGGRVGFV